MKKSEYTDQVMHIRDTFWNTKTKKLEHGIRRPRNLVLERTNTLGIHLIYRLIDWLVNLQHLTSNPFIEIFPRLMVELKTPQCIAYCYE